MTKTTSKKNYSKHNQQYIFESDDTYAFTDLHQNDELYESLGTYGCYMRKQLSSGYELQDEWN